MLDTTQESPVRYYVAARNNLGGKPGAILYACGLKRFSLNPDDTIFRRTEDGANKLIRNLEEIEPRNLKYTHPSFVDAQVLIITDKMLKEGFDLRVTAE